MSRPRPLSGRWLGAAPGTPAHHQLSDREFQVLTMMGQGLTVKQTAAELSLSVKTVSTYRARVLEKLGLSTTAEMIGYAIRNQLAE